MKVLSHQYAKKRGLSQSVQASAVLLPSDACIICDKKKKIHGSTQTEKLVKCETKAAETLLKNMH